MKQCALLRLSNAHLDFVDVFFPSLGNTRVPRPVALLKSSERGRPTPAISIRYEIALISVPMLNMHDRGFAGHRGGDSSAKGSNDEEER